MSRQVSRGSAGEYQADEQAGVARLRWRGHNLATEQTVTQVIIILKTFSDTAGLVLNTQEKL